MLLLSISKVSTYIFEQSILNISRKPFLEEKIEAYIQRMRLVSIIHILFFKKACRVPNEEKTEGW